MGQIPTSMNFTAEDFKMAPNITRKLAKMTEE